MEQDKIKTMKLYNHIERIQSELEIRGMLESDHIDPIALSEIDSMHYTGISVIEDAIAAMKIDSSSSVLDVGSGFGGTARILSAKSRCATTALELQRDIHEMAVFLTKKCQLDDCVKHVMGDILTLDMNELGGGISTFDGVVSLLVFLHITDKSSLLKRCAKVLKPGGTLFIEDFYCRSPFSEEEAKSLVNDVYAVELPTREEYISQLETSGFQNIQFIDKSTEWTEYVHHRLFRFMYTQYRFEEIHGKRTYRSLLHFYNAVAVLFSSGNLGGVRIIAEVKLPE